MKIKIVGIGKCGVRIAYDFFAYTSGIPSAYEIRLNRSENSGLSKGLADIGLPVELVKKPIEALRSALRNLAGEFKSVYRIAERPEYVTIDSDSDNNEITSVPTISRINSIG